MASHLPKDKYRVVMMGAACVGKSCIISRFMYEKYMDKYKATVEEFYNGVYEVNGREIKLEILDTAGAYDFPAMRKLAISTGDAFVLVYSVEDEASFDEVRRLRDQILEEKDKEQAPPIVVVGNKADVDLKARAITKEEAEGTVNIDWDNGYVEVSAKDDVNVSAIFHELLVQSKVSLNGKPPLRRYNTQPIMMSKKKHPKLTKRNSCTIA